VNSRHNWGAASGAAGQEERGIGPDGITVLVASCAIIALSLGMTLMLALAFVLYVAVGTPREAPPCRRILVPGMRLMESGQPGRDYAARIARAASLWTNMNSARIVILGGRSSALLPSEARAGWNGLRAAGVPAANLILEEQSRHTLENLRHYRAAFADSLTEPVLLVTNRFHLARCALLAGGLSVPYRLCPAEQRRVPPLRHAPRMLFETMLVHWYITGRMLADISGSRRLAARIR
jgi:uncharacterized SAM-binding protein YcdF (DUF218 family)